MLAAHGKPCFCPLPKRRGRFDDNGENDEFAFFPLKTRAWEIQTGAHKRGLEPQIFRENRAKILPGKSGLFGPDWSLFRAFRALFGADWCFSERKKGT